MHENVHVSHNNFYTKKVTIVKYFETSIFFLTINSDKVDKLNIVSAITCLEFDSCFNVLQNSK